MMLGISMWGSWSQGLVVFWVVGVEDGSGSVGLLLVGVEVTEAFAAELYSRDAVWRKRMEGDGTA